MQGSVERQGEPIPPAERQFGLGSWLVFGPMCAMLARCGHGDGWPWFGLAARFTGLAWLDLTPRYRLNVGRASFGVLLHRLATPLLMGLTFFAVLSPSGMLMRLLGQGPLRLRRGPATTRFWRAYTKGVARRGAALSDECPVRASWLKSASAVLDRSASALKAPPQHLLAVANPPDHGAHRRPGGAATGCGHRPVNRHIGVLRSGFWMGSACASQASRCSTATAPLR